MSTRRDFITLLGGAAAWPLAAQGQPASRAARLGYFAPASNPDLQQALLGGLRDLGYVEGHNLAIEYRLMLGQSKTYDELAAELARLAPDAIVVVGTPPALAAKRQTTTIPIIMAPAADLLRSGLVTSLSRPGQRDRCFALWLRNRPQTDGGFQGGRGRNPTNRSALQCRKSIASVPMG